MNEPPLSPISKVSQPSSLVLVRRIAWSCVAAAVLIGVVVYALQQFLVVDLPTAKESAKAAIKSEFTLTDHRGKLVTGDHFKGRWQIVFFGYTFCPDICPTTMNTISETLDGLGEDAKHVAALFITVDPERDTKEILAEYVSAFHPGITGLTGTAEQIRFAARSFKVYYSKAEKEDAPDGYLMGHSGYMYLMNPEGEFEAIFRDEPNAAEKIAESIREKMKLKKQ